MSDPVPVAAISDSAGARAVRALDAAFPPTPLNLLARAVNDLAGILPHDTAAEPIFGLFDKVGEYVGTLLADRQRLTDQCDGLYQAVLMGRNEQARLVADRDRLRAALADVLRVFGLYYDIDGDMAGGMEDEDGEIIAAARAVLAATNQGDPE